MSKRIITVARQFGSNGSEIAKKVSEILNIGYYDKELLEKAAEDSGISKEVFERADEQATNSFLYSLAVSGYGGNISPMGINDVMMNDRLFAVQSDSIRKIANENDCVIVGRCADDLLSTFEGLTRIFIYAPVDVRIKSISSSLGIDENDAKSLIKKKDKKRASYYNFYTGKTWGNRENYDLMINSDFLGIDETAKFIAELVLAKENRH